MFIYTSVCSFDVSRSRPDGLKTFTTRAINFLGPLPLGPKILRTVIRHHAHNSSWVEMVILVITILWNTESYKWFCPRHSKEWKRWTHSSNFVCSEICLQFNDVMLWSLVYSPLCMFPNISIAARVMFANSFLLLVLNLIHLCKVQEVHA